MSVGAAEFDYLQKLVHRHAGIVLETGKEYLAEARLGLLANREGFTSVAEMVAWLRAERPAGVHRKVVEAMATNETSFFRDLHPFRVLRDRVFPGLAAELAADRRLSVWCAGCSSGQEPYSLAMTLREEGPFHPAGFPRILASDLSAAMIERARSGIYSQLEVNRGLPASLLVKYFLKIGADWQINDEVRRMVEFRQLNLAENWPPMPAMDVILMRNVLIYFDQGTRRSVLGRVRRLLRSGGYLVLGGSESRFYLDDAFEAVELGGVIVYRMGGREETGCSSPRTTSAG